MHNLIKFIDDSPPLLISLLSSLWDSNSDFELSMFSSNSTHCHKVEYGMKRENSNCWTVLQCTTKIPTLGCSLITNKKPNTLLVAWFSFREQAVQGTRNDKPQVDVFWQTVGTAWFMMVMFSTPQPEKE